VVMLDAASRWFRSYGAASSVCVKLLACSPVLSFLFHFSSSFFLCVYASGFIAYMFVTATFLTK
jgi:hypothetical protein